MWQLKIMWNVSDQCKLMRDILEALSPLGHNMIETGSKFNHLQRLVRIRMLTIDLRFMFVAVHQICGNHFDCGVKTFGVVKFNQWNYTKIFTEKQNNFTLQNDFNLEIRF